MFLSQHRIHLKMFCIYKFIIHLLHIYYNKYANTKNMLDVRRVKKLLIVK